ncbi:MAG: hypothetical protein ABL900_16470 [Burkholderiaceae bacterium]
MLDQIWLSAMSLAISLAFIRFATKEDYGAYLILLTPLSLVQGIQNALILSPIATVLPGASKSEAAVVHSTAVASLTAFVVVAAVISAIGLSIYQWTEFGTLQPTLILGFSLAVAGIGAREGARTLCYAKGMAWVALRSDLIYGGGLLAGILALCYFTILSPENALLATAIAALWTYAFRLRHLGALEMDPVVLRKFWACGKWAIGGVLVTWVNLSAYPLVVGAALGSDAVAEINVARLFLVPVALAIAAWSNVCRPKISGWMAQGMQSEIENVSVRSIRLGLVMLAIAAALLLLAYPSIEPHLGGAYRGLRPIVILWVIFFALNLARSVFMATLMTTAADYKRLQAASWVALIVALPGLALLSSLGSIWVVGVLVAAEAVHLLMIRGPVIRRWKGAAVVL